MAASQVSINPLQGVTTGGATTTIDYNLTPNKVVASDADGKISTSSVANIEVSYVAGNNDLVQTQVNSKANQSSTYSKTEVDHKLALKANQSTTYSKIEVDSTLAFKADQATTYTTTVVDNNLALQANQATTYSKTEVDINLVLKANQATI